MRGPKLAAVLVALAMVMTFAYAAHSSLRAAKAGVATIERASNCRLVERVIQETDRDMGTRR